MSIRHHTCLTVDCDVCGAPLQDFEDATLHFATEDEARRLARYYRWPISGSGRFICPQGDADHQAAMDELLPPAPLLVPEGQLDFDGGEQR